MMFGFKVKFQHVLDIDFHQFFELMNGQHTMMGSYPEIGLFHLLAKGSADYVGLDDFITEPSKGLRLLSWQRMKEATHDKPLVFTDCFGRKCVLSYSRRWCQFVLSIRHETRSQPDLPCHPEFSNKKIGALMSRSS